jgi:hypothetical protein
MINEKETPVEWSQLLYELEDAREHLDDLITKMSASGSIEVEELAVDLGHIFAHLNRTWNSRNQIGELSEHQQVTNSQFPNDLNPVG